MRFFIFLSGTILIAIIIASDSIGVYSELPLPDANDVNRYFKENSQRFYHRSPYNKDFNADHITPVPFYSIFKSHIIFWVRCDSSRYLENLVIGSNASYGLFASNGKEILYLSRSNMENIGTLFKNEKIQIDEVDAKIFCDFLSLTILKNEYNSYKVISSISDIINQVRTDSYRLTIREDRSVQTFHCESSVGYEINEAEINKIKDLIHPPKISGNKIFGWKVEFYSWGGSLNEVTDVSRHVFKISGKYKVRHTEWETLTTQIFSKIPTVMY